MSFKSRVGEENYNNFGSKMIIVEYRKRNDIDIMFPEYDNFIVKNKQYGHFKNGSVSCPLEKRKNVSRNKINGDKIYWRNGTILEYNLELLKKYIKEESKNHESKSSLTDKMGVHRGFLDRVEKIEGIKFELNLVSTKSNSVNFKAVYQNYEWCYDNFFNKGLNHEEMADLAGCSKRVIEKWCTEKHRLTQKFRQKNKQLTDEQRDLIIGSVIGDGHIDKRETQPVFVVSYAENQKDYLYWKYEILKDLCNIPPTYINKKETVFFGKTYSCQPMYRISTRVQDCFIPIRDMTKRQIIDLLNEFSLSIFVLDDGNRGVSNWSICLAGLELEDRIYFSEIMKSKFDLNCKIELYDNRYATIDAESSRKLDDIIKSNIPNNLDIIQSKIINNNIKKQQVRIKTIFQGKEIYLKDFCDNMGYKYKYVYSIYKKLNLLTGESIIEFIENRGVDNE